MNPARLILACRSKERGDKAAKGLLNSTPLSSNFSSTSHNHNSSNTRSNILQKCWELAFRPLFIRIYKGFRRSVWSWGWKVGYSNRECRGHHVGIWEYEGWLGEFVSPSSQLQYIKVIDIYMLGRVQVNHLGTALLTLLLLPSLARTNSLPLPSSTTSKNSSELDTTNNSPRITIVSSEVHFDIKSLPDRKNPSGSILAYLNDKKKAKMMERYHVTKCESWYHSSRPLSHVWWGCWSWVVSDEYLVYEGVGEED